jgi:hypothetical protein
VGPQGLPASFFLERRARGITQAALEHAIATGSERIEAVEATVQLKRRTTLSP